MKCIPILFGVDVKDDFPIFFGCFYKYLYHCKENNWPILAQEEYYVDPKYYQKNYSIDLKIVSKINEIPNISLKMFENVDKYTITNEETNDVLSNYKDKDEAWIKLMNNYDEKLASVLDAKIKRIKSKYKDLSYAIVWRHNETVKSVLKKYDIELIEMELSGVRIPSYNFGLCYFQYSNKYDDKEFNDRHKKFIKETMVKKVPMLSRKQLINLLLTKKEINNMRDEEYDVGVALGLKRDYETLSTGSITNEEILEQLSMFEDNSNIIIRKHPANYNYKYKNEEKYIIDNSVSSVQFVSRCRKIISSVSNIGFEAMILGKTTYTLGKMPFKAFGYSSLEYNDEYIINVNDINFLVFGYYAPYDLALKKEYIKFRSGNPSEYDIYMYHYNYIMNKYSINKCYNTSVHDIYINRKNIKDNLENKIVKMNKEINVLKEDVEFLETENNRLKQDIDNIINSKSWKVTKPLRKILGKINKTRIK